MTFAGFGDAIGFFQGLAADNSSAYWRAHKSEYAAAIAEPMAALADALTDEFGNIHRFRPQRDVRFSPDKRPYQEVCSMAAGQDSPGPVLYFQLGLDGLMVAGGRWQPDTATVQQFRRAIDDPGTASDFDAELARFTAQGFELDGRPLSTAPRGWPRDHPRIDLLRLRNLALHKVFDPEPWVRTPQCLTVVADAWRALSGWNAWLDRHLPLATPAPTRQDDW